MAIFGRGFAGGLAVGARAGSHWVDQYRDGVERQEAQDTKDFIGAQVKSAEAESAASGGTQHTLDAGLGNPNAPDYVAKDKGNIDFIAQQERDIAGLQAQGAGQETPAPQGNGVETAGLRPQANLQERPLPEAGLTPTQGMAEALGTKLAPEPAPAPQAEAPKEGFVQGQIDAPKLSTMDIFHKKYAPKVMERFMKSGDIDKAQAFENWSRGAKGASYGDAWLKGMQKLESGDTHGGMMAAQDIYNKQLPDGQYAVAVPGKNGEYTIQIRDEKTHQLRSSNVGKGPDLAQAAYAMLSPDKAFAFAHAQETAAVARRNKITDDERNQEQAIALKAAPDGKDDTPSPHMKMIKERNRYPVGSPTYNSLDKKIKLGETRGEGITLQIGTPNDDGLVPVKNRADGTTKMVPVKGAVTNADKAGNALKGIKEIVDQPSVDNPNPKPYLVRNGKKISPYGATKKEYEEIQKHIGTLREAGKAPPWEAPGL